MNRQLFETYMALDNWHQFRLRLFIEGIFVGIAGGLSISLFRFLLNESEDLRIYLYYACLIPALRRDDLLPLLSYALLLLAIGSALYAMCRYAPMAGGSGIPQVKGVILGLMKMKWLRILWVKILAGAIGIGAGFRSAAKVPPSRSVPSPGRASPACSAGHAWKSATSSPAVRVQGLPPPSMHRSPA